MGNDDAARARGEKGAADAGAAAGGAAGEKGAAAATWPDGLALFDAHLHLDWFRDPAGATRELAQAGAGAYAVTVTPAGFLAARPALAGCPNVWLAAGLHPWWLADGRCGPADVEALCRLVAQGQRWVGEVGVDLSPRRVGADGGAAQLAAFRRVCAASARASDPQAPTVLSIHAVRAAGAVLDVLDETGCAARCRCVLHWFSGTPDELRRAVRLGVRVSLGERALSTRRGREHARVAPAWALLAETDLPPEPGWEGPAGDVAASLGRATEALAAARGLSPADARALVLANARELLS